jgi:hypothetical protein
VDGLVFAGYYEKLMPRRKNTDMKLPVKTLPPKQVLDKKAEKYLREIADIEDLPEQEELDAGHSAARKSKARKKGE